MVEISYPNVSYSCRVRAPEDPKNKDRSPLFVGLSFDWLNFGDENKPWIQALAIPVEDGYMQMNVGVQPDFETCFPDAVDPETGKVPIKCMGDLARLLRASGVHSDLKNMFDAMDPEEKVHMMRPSASRRVDVKPEHLPENLLPIGDAITMTNPAYGIGMSEALTSVEALAIAISEAASAGASPAPLRKIQGKYIHLHHEFHADFWTQAEDDYKLHESYWSFTPLGRRPDPPAGWGVKLVIGRVINPVVNALLTPVSKRARDEVWQDAMRTYVLPAINYEAAFINMLHPRALYIGVRNWVYEMVLNE
jgi:hypothetical protein